MEEFLNTGEIDCTVKWVEKDKTGWNYGETSIVQAHENRCKSVEEIAARRTKIKRKW